MVNAANHAARERRRRELLRRFYELVDEAERQPRRTTSGFPFGVLERSIDWLLLFLERRVGQLVDSVLARVSRLRRR